MPVSLTESLPIHLLSGVNSNPSSLWRELHGIGQEIEKNLFDLPLITNEVAQALINRNVEFDAVLGGPFAHKRACVVDRQGHIKRCQLQLHASRFDLGEIEDLIDKG